MDSTYYTVYDYDYENRLVEVTLPDSSTNEFTYDGDKRRIFRKDASGDEKWFLYDGINILQDVATDGTRWTSYVQGIGIDKLISVSEWAGQTTPNIRYYHSDAIGSVRSLTDASETEVKTYAYDAWGKVTVETGTDGNEYKFTSRRWEEDLGLQYNRARFYDPETGRFITPDPLTGGPDDPSISYFDGVYSLFHRFIKEHVDALRPDKLNRYVYCYNNPVNLIDPLGLSADEDATAEVKVEAEQAETGQKEEEKASQAQEIGPKQEGETAEAVRLKAIPPEDPRFKELINELREGGGGETLTDLIKAKEIGKNTADAIEKGKVGLVDMKDISAEDKEKLRIKPGTRGTEFDDKVIVINFANPDRAATAVEEVNHCVNKDFANRLEAAKYSMNHYQKVVASQEMRARQVQDAYKGIRRQPSELKQFIINSYKLQEITAKDIPDYPSGNRTNSIPNIDN